MGIAKPQAAMNLHNDCIGQKPLLESGRTGISLPHGGLQPHSILIALKILALLMKSLTTF
jgi:hypothetical protein